MTPVPFADPALLPMPALRPQAATLPPRLPLKLGGRPVEILAARAVLLPATRTLLVADLHLDKGAMLSAGRGPLPQHDLPETLGRLEALVLSEQPRQVVCLGDSVHRRQSWALLPDFAIGRLKALIDRVEGPGGRWIWLAGNHDPLPPESLGGHAAERAVIEDLLLLHAPPPAASALPLSAQAAIAGHLHPKAKLPVGGSAPCFVLWRDLLLIPAFGAFTGGLSVHDPAIQSLRSERPLQIICADRRGCVRLPVAQATADRAPPGRPVSRLAPLRDVDQP